MNFTADKRLPQILLLPRNYLENTHHRKGKNNKALPVELES
jgi:hypothetical protein